MLTRFLMQYGKFFIYTTEFLTIIEQLRESFDGTFTTTRVKDADLHNLFVIYLFRDLTEAQISRWYLQHFQHTLTTTDYFIM